MSKDADSGAKAALEAFKSREDLKQYASNGLLLFALQLRRGIDDIHAIAADALTDGSDDKGCDLVYVDADTHSAIIAQSYVAEKPKQAASSSKAAVLGTAAAWLLATDLKKVPSRLQPAAKELRKAINDGEIHRLEFWYAHNCNESSNVSKELEVVKNSARTLIDRHFPGNQTSEISCSEVGINTLREWYHAILTPILVTQKYSVDIPGGYSLKSREWHSYSTAVPAKWLHNLYKTHSKRLFSANVRDYLGSRRSESNVNSNIKRSVTEQPENLCVFNNGTTALTNKIKILRRKGKGSILQIRGISIVNGAQTTGAIGSIPGIPDKSALVPARFIEVSSSELIHDIVRYNNSQNKLAAADFRSTDSVQERLRQEFSQRRPRLLYSGGRRGGASDAIARPGNQLHSDTVAQSLTAFHGNPSLAYSKKGDIWESDGHYHAVFHENTHAEHIVFVYSLYLTIRDIRDGFTKATRENKALPKHEEELASFMRQRGSIHLAVGAIGACMEVLLGKQVPSLFDLRFSSGMDLDQAKERWRPVVDACLALHESLQSFLDADAKAEADFKKQVAQFKGLVLATKSGNTKTYRDFASRITNEPWPTPKGASVG